MPAIALLSMQLSRLSQWQDRGPAQGRSYRPRWLRKLTLGTFDHICCLWTFLALSNFEFDLIAFLKTLVPFNGDGAIVHDHIRTAFPAAESVTFGVVEPFHNSCQTFHGALSEGFNFRCG